MSSEMTESAERFVFDNEHDFLEKLKELVKSGVDRKKIDFLTPYPVHNVEKILSLKPSGVRVFGLRRRLPGLSCRQWQDGLGSTGL